MTTDLALPLETMPVPRGARLTLWVAIVGLSALVAWAAVSSIDQVTRAQAQIIASSRTQVVQAPDPGVLTQMLVKEGDIVKAGQRLATLEKARAQAAVDDGSAKVAALQITLARLHAEVYGKPLVFAPNLRRWREYIDNQTSLYQKRRTAFEQDIASLAKALALAQEELDMNRGLERSGDVSRADLLRLQRQAADIEAQIANKRNKYFQDAQTEMTKAQEDLNTQAETLRDRVQLLEHTDLVAPTDGIVKNVRVTTLGGVVRAGDTVVEILPTDTDLLAEAKISPAEIGFIAVGQSASVKLDAYDYTIFGTLKGEVTYISADTLMEETRNGTQPFYRVQVRVHEAEFAGRHGTQQLQVRPGMTASVDIKAMERSVLSYLTKPITKTLAQSLGER